MVRQACYAVAALLLSSVLPSCATVLEEPAQDLRIDIVGTGEALCDVTQPGRRYRAYAPGTIRVMKSDDPMKVTCAAPGNRELSITLVPKMTPMLAANVFNGVVPGVTWDYLSGASHHYPDKLVMDFSNLPPLAYDVPDYQHVLDKNPHIAGMEMFRPGRSALLSDVGQKHGDLPKRAESESSGIVLMDAPSATTSTDKPAAASSSTKSSGAGVQNFDALDQSSDK